MIKRSEELDRYLNLTVDKGGSDLHLQTGSKPAIRILGDVVFLDEEVLTHQRTEALVKEVLDESHFNTLFKSFYFSIYVVLVNWRCYCLAFCVIHFEN